eukprot:SAG31_NODE_1046_length_10177_cov_13.677218_3_plen_63_part_00
MCVAGLQHLAIGKGTEIPWHNTTLAVVDKNGKVWTEAMVDKLEREVAELRHEVIGSSTDRQT